MPNNTELAQQDAQHFIDEARAELEVRHGASVTDEQAALQAQFRMIRALNVVNRRVRGRNG